MGSSKRIKRTVKKIGNSKGELLIESMASFVILIIVIIAATGMIFAAINMKICGLKKGAEVLEIGCGEGETTEHLEKDYGYKMTAIDLSLDMVDKAKKRGLKADIKFGDGECLEDFLSFTEDCIVMECVLSLINLPDEALHEAYCVLRNGGKLFISDLYIKDPDPEKVRAIKMEADRQARIPHGTR